MRALVLVGLIATLASSACSDETGILVKTTTQSSTLGPIDHLRYFVGTREINLPDNGDASNLFVDFDPLDVVDLDGRDLGAAPHLLMIRPQAGADSGERYAIGVLAFDDAGTVVGAGYVLKPVGFVQGSVTQWTIYVSNSNEGPTDCLRWEVGGTKMAIGSGNDLDCDDFAAGLDDCDDRDPKLNRGQAEDCSNGIDDNCDGVVDGPSVDPDYPSVEEADGADNTCDGICDGPQPAESTAPGLDEDGDGFTKWGRYGVCSATEGPDDCDLLNGELRPGVWDYCDTVDSNCDDLYDEPTPCFVVENGNSRCVQGERACPDKGSTPTDCTALLVEDATLTFDRGCTTLSNCSGPAGVGNARCLLENLQATDAFAVECTTWYAPATGVCSTGSVGFDFPVKPIESGLRCTYQIIGPSLQQGYSVGLQEGNIGPARQVVNACSEVHLHVETTAASGNATILIAYSRRSEVTGTDTETIYKVRLDSVALESTQSCADVTNNALACTEWSAVASN